MQTFRSLFAAAALAAASSAAWAETDSAMRLPGDALTPAHLGQGFFAGAGFRGQSTGLGTFDNGAITFNRGSGFVPVSTFETRMTMYGPEGLIGYRFAPGALPPWLGANLRIVVSGWWLSGSVTENESGFIADGTPFRYGTLSGRTVALGTFGGNATTQDSVYARGTAFEVALKAASDIPVAPRLILTPGVELFGGASRTETYHATLDSFLERFETNATVHSRTIGGRVRATLTYWITQSVGLHLSGHVAGAHRHAEFDAFSCVDASTGGTGLCVSPNTTSTLSGSANRAVFIGGGTLGMTLVAGNAFLVKLAAGATYDSAVPGLQSPVYGPTVGSTGQAARLNFTGRTSFHASARLVVLIF